MIQTAHHLQVLEAGQVLVHCCVLTREPDPGAQHRRVLLDVVPGNARAAAVGAQERCEHFHERRLPGAVRAEQAVDDPGGDGQIDVVERANLAERLAQALRLDGDIGGYGRGRSHVLIAGHLTDPSQPRPALVGFRR